MPYREFEPEHVPLMKIWEFANILVTLEPHEHIHLRECERCRAVFRASVRCKSVDEVKEQIGYTR